MTAGEFIQKWDGRGAVSLVIVSPKYGRLTVLIDEKDKELLKGRGLYVSKSGRFLYVRVGPGKKLLHRLITDAPSDRVVDHINRNTLDNRRDNLRVCTIQENLRNQKRSNSKTGFTGVTAFGKYGFTAQIKHNYKKIHLGVFSKLQDAINARKKAELEYWGVA